MGEFFRIENKEGVATIWIDRQGHSQNVISPELIGEFESLLKQIEGDSSLRGAVIISAKEDFIAGADINSFQAEKPGDFAPVLKAGHAIMDKIQAAKIPVVAAIHGTCFGLGTEMSLACTARIISDDPRSKMALPEVKLGLLPGSGGTQRLPRLVGLQASLDMMLTGRNIFPYRARKIGLVDEVTNKSKLHSAARQLVLRIADGRWQRRKKKQPLLMRFLDNTSIGRSIVFSQAKKRSAKQAMGNYPAVPAIIDCVETGLKRGLKAGFAKEVELFEQLLIGPESRALRSLFFRMSDNKKNPWENPRKINRMGVLGAGLMGAGIADVSADKGIDVLLKDITTDMLRSARKSIWKTLQKRLRRRAISKPAAQAQMSRVSMQLDYAGFQNVPLVIEAVVENMDVKKKIITELENVCNDDFIFASNTSSLSLTEMAKASKHPENVIGMHYFSPVPKMPLLEIVKTEFTSDETLATCYDLGVRQGKTIIVVNDGPGFYVNRILAPYINECLLMIEEGAKVEKVDYAMKKLGFPVGPLQLLDEVGLDIAAHIMGQGMIEFAAGREGFEVSRGVMKMYEASYHGKKNGKGFYSYSGKKKKPDSGIYQYFGGAARKSLPMEEMQNRGLMLMLNEAVMCLQEGIIRDQVDGDLGAVFGIGFLPFTGGPFSYLESEGVSTVAAKMKELEKKFGPKFKPVFAADSDLTYQG